MRWTDKIFASQTIAGIEIILENENKIFNYSVLRKTKKSFEILVERNNVQELKIVDLPAGIPVCVVINGKGIIHKKIHGSEKKDDRFLLSQILPTGNLDDFFLQKVSASEGNILVSVIRQNIVNAILEMIKAAFPKNEIVHASLGPFCILKILPVNGKYENEIRFAGHYVTYLPDRTIHGYLNEPGGESVNYNIGSITVHEKNLISASIAYQFIMGHKDYKVQNVPLIIQAERRVEQKRKFEARLAFILVFFLAILTVNYFVFEHYWNKRNVLASQFVLNQDAFSRLEKLKADFSERERFLQTTGFLESSRLSYYADQVALNLPESIFLTRMNLNPQKLKMGDKGDLAFNNKTVTVSGTCRKSTEINEWIKLLKQKPWIKDLVMVNYSFDTSRELADFTIEISTKAIE